MRDRPCEYGVFDEDGECWETVMAQSQDQAEDYFADCWDLETMEVRNLDI